MISRSAEFLAPPFFQFRLNFTTEVLFARALEIAISSPTPVVKYWNLIILTPIRKNLSSSRNPRQFEALKKNIYIGSLCTHLICDTELFESFVELQRLNHQLQLFSSDLVRFQRQWFESRISLQKGDESLPKGNYVQWFLPNKYDIILL